MLFVFAPLPRLRAGVLTCFAAGSETSGAEASTTGVSFFSTFGCFVFVTFFGAALGDLAAFVFFAEDLVALAGDFLGEVFFLDFVFFTGLFGDVAFVVAVFGFLTLVITGDVFSPDLALDFGF